MLELRIFSTILQFLLLVLIFNLDMPLHQNGNMTWDNQKSIKM